MNKKNAPFLSEWGIAFGFSSSSTKWSKARLAGSGQGIDASVGVGLQRVQGCGCAVAGIDSRGREQDGSVERWCIRTIHHSLVYCRQLSQHTGECMRYMCCRDRGGRRSNLRVDQRVWCANGDNNQCEHEKNSFFHVDRLLH